MREHTHLSAMVGLVREHVAQHFRANRPRLSPAVPEKLVDAATAPERFGKHLFTASGALRQSRAGLLRRAARTVKLSRNLQVRGGKPHPLGADIVHVRKDRRDGACLALWLGFPRDRIQMFDKHLIDALIRGKDPHRGSAQFCALSRLNLSRVNRMLTRTHGCHSLTNNTAAPSANRKFLHSALDQTVINSTSMNDSKNHGLLACVVALLVVSAIPKLGALERPQSGKGDQSITAIPELVETRYCRGDDEVYSVWLKLRMKYVNRTNKTLILDKEIGKAWYRAKVARNLGDLAAGKYEYNPNIDWFFSDKDNLPDKPNSDSPGPGFVMLAPGKSFVGEINATVIAQYENPKNFSGSIRSGVHVFQMELSAWNHPGGAEVFAQSWHKLGELVTGLVKTEPLEIRIPSNPKVEKKCE